MPQIGDPEQLVPITHGSGLDPATVSNRRDRDISSEGFYESHMAKRRTVLEHWSKATEAEDDNLATQLMQVAFQNLLEAWAARLGCRSPDGYTRYSKRMSTRACLELRDLMANGDPETGLKFEELGKREEWEGKMAAVKWWFDTAGDAIDFLSFLGRGPTRFGQEEVRVDAARYRRADTHRCIDRVHNAAMQVFYGYALRLSDSEPDLAGALRFDNKMRETVCACVDQAKLVKLLAERQGAAGAETPRVLEAYTADIRQRWVELNNRARRAGDDRDLMYVMQVENKEFRTSWWLQQLEDGVTEVVGFRVEGAVAELL